MHIFDAACLLFFKTCTKKTKTIYIFIIFFLFCCFAFESRLRRIFFLFNFFVFIYFFEHTLFPFMPYWEIELNLLTLFFYFALNFSIFQYYYFISLFKAKTLINRNIQWLLCRSFNFKQICHFNLSFNSFK